MRIVWILVLSWVAVVSRCEEPRPKAPAADPRPGDFVRLRGTLGDDVDCRTIRVDDSGKVYSLSARLRGWPNGSKICVHGTLVEVTQCMTSPMIEVQALRPLSACP